MKIIISPDTYISLLSPVDTLSLFEVINRNRDYLKQWLPWLDLVSTLEQTQTFIETAIYRHNESESSSYAVYHQDNLAGVASFNTLDFQNKSATIGYWLAEPFSGRGIITAVVSCLVDYGFKDYGLHKIEIRCATQNNKSRAIPERLGFFYEGTFRQCEWLYDHFVDHSVYSILETEFFKHVKQQKI